MARPETDRCVSLCAEGAGFEPWVGVNPTAVVKTGSRDPSGSVETRLLPFAPSSIGESGDRVPSGAVRFRWPTHVMAPGMGPGFDLSRPAQQVRISRTRRNERSCARFGGRLGRRLQLERHGRPTEQALPPGKLVGPLSEGLVHGPLVRGRCSEMPRRSPITVLDEVRPIVLQ